MNEPITATKYGFHSGIYPTVLSGKEEKRKATHDIIQQALVKGAEEIWG